MKKRNNKGFTLIELLAVIIILGILMIIAIPSVTTYIQNSRKSAYIDTAKEIISGARTFVNQGKVPMYDTNVTYYINYKCISTENASKSPYGEFVDGETYVVVTYNGSGFNYYWVSRDETGQGVKTLTMLNDLDEEDIEANIAAGEIKSNVPVGNRTKTQIINASCEKEEENAADTANAVADDNIENTSSGVVYPEGKDKSSVSVGEIVKIGTEEFYVISNENNELVLLAKYNLLVGDIYEEINTLPFYKYKKTLNESDPGYGLQSTKTIYDRQSKQRVGVVPFSGKEYWVDTNNQLLPYYTNNGASYSGNPFPYVYRSDMSSIPPSIDYQNMIVLDNGYTIAYYIEKYIDKLIDLGAPNNIKGRLLSYEDAINSGCDQYDTNCSLYMYNDSSYWWGSASDYNNIWYLFYDSYFTVNNPTECTRYGVRPVIVI